MVVSGYLALGETQRNKVKTLITLGSPLLGTPVAPAIWATEDIGIIIPDIKDWVRMIMNAFKDSFNIIDYLLKDFQSIYELFPTKKYFDSEYANQFYVVKQKISEEEITNYLDTEKCLSQYLLYYDNNVLRVTAENFHESLYQDSEHISCIVNTYYISGYNISTIDKLYLFLNIIDGTYSWYRLSSSIGDSIVPTTSASLGDKYPSKTFYAENVTHMGLLSNLDVLSFINGLIAGITYVPNDSCIKNDYN